MGPPAWMAMVFLQMKYHLDIGYVLVYGVIGSVLGRYIMSLYFRKISHWLINERKNKDLKFLGGKLSDGLVRSWIFVFIYTLVPLPTTPLFNVMGVARVKAINVIPPFLAGKFMSDGLMLYAGTVAAENITELLSGMLTWKSLLVSALGLMILAGILFIDWWTLLEKKQLKITFDIWNKKKVPDVPLK